MAKWYGVVGYVTTEETRPGVWTPKTVERPYYGDLVKNFNKVQTSDKVNSDISVADDISIVADPYAHENFQAIRYVEFMGAKWSVTTAQVQYPRIILSIGGVYNGQ